MRRPTGGCSYTPRQVDRRRGASIAAALTVLTSCAQAQDQQRELSLWQIAHGGHILLPGGLPADREHWSERAGAGRTASASRWRLPRLVRG